MRWAKANEGVKNLEMQHPRTLRHSKSGMIGQLALPRPTMETVIAKVVRGLFIKLGPVFIKLGVILSMRAEVTPSIKEELRVLQDNAPHERQRVQMESDKGDEGVGLDCG